VVSAANRNVEAGTLPKAVIEATFVAFARRFDICRFNKCIATLRFAALTATYRRHDFAACGEPSGEPRRHDLVRRRIEAARKRLQRWPVFFASHQRPPKCPRLPV